MERLVASLSECEVTAIEVRAEPDLERVDQALTHARASRAEVVIGLGGGSVLDTAKAVAGLLTHEGSALDYMEVVGRGVALVRPAAPLIAIPTTAGSGTEVTKNAVIAAPTHKFKASIRSEFLLPRIALVDSSLTDTLPPAITASTGMDALTQLLEPFVSVRAQPVTDALALEGLDAVQRSLRRAVAEGADAAARDDMSLASLLGGICLANAGLGAVHGIAAPLGASFPVPHGFACAALLPRVARANIAALSARAPQGPALKRYARAFTVLTQTRAPTPELLETGCRWLESLARDLAIPGLSQYGVTEQSIPDIVARAQNASSMKANPVRLTDRELSACISAAL
jgi:alcohol dehydrogenase class IV